MTHRILKEEPNPDWKEGDDLAERSRFLPTGEFYKGDDPQGRVNELQASEGGCYAAESVSSK